tara:strand:- start:447 stop:626 length:180 start_codon:yes stop_codon:yes gene_type:complete
MVTNSTILRTEKRQRYRVSSECDRKKKKIKDTKNALNGAFFYLQSIINSVIIIFNKEKR